MSSEESNDEVDNEVEAEEEAEGEEEEVGEDGLTNTQHDNLVEEFRKHVETAHDLINAKIAIADQALSEAVAIAEEYGVSFYADVSPLGQSYMVDPLDKYEVLDSSLVNDICGTYSEYGYEGWQHSAVC